MGSSFLAGQSLSVVDLALYSLVKQLSLEKDLQPELSKWFDRTTKDLGIKSGASNRNRNSSMRKSGGSPKKGDRRTPEKEKSPKKDFKKGKGSKEDKKAQQKPGKDSVTPSNHFGKDQLFEFFQQNTINYTNVDHPEVFTVDAMMPYLKNIKGAICKNLFLKDKKKNFYLLATTHNKEVKLNDVAKKIGAKELRFGDESIMIELLGVSQGCVTAYALANDPQNKVKFIVDTALLDGTFTSVNFHPMVNTATTCISCEDFKKFLNLTGHSVIKF